MAIDFGAKLGPLPYWGWIGGSVVLVYAYEKYKANKTAAAGTVATSGTDLSGGADSIDGLGSGTSAAGTVSTIGGVAPPTTDSAWSIQAANDMIAQGYDPSLTESALSDYLAGNPLSQAEQSVISVALGKFGSPPEGTVPVNPAATTPNPPPVVTPTPAPAPAPSPAPPPETGPAPTPWFPSVGPTTPAVIPNFTGVEPTPIYGPNPGNGAGAYDTPPGYVFPLVGGRPVV